MVEALDEQLRQPVVVAGGEVLHITIAVGISYTKAPWLQLADLLRDSDRDMYRSRLRCHQIGQPPTSRPVGRG